MLPTACTSCGCEYAPDGFYYTNGELEQPCKVCRCDQQSIYYYNNAEAIREKRRNRYYADLAASREKDRNRKRQKSAQQQPAQISVLS
jgi:hypothetical protein